MKKVSVKRGVAFLALGSVAMLMLLSGYLFRQRKMYEQHNRQLIIQNDSIMSVNIELTKALQTKQSSFQKMTLNNYQPRKVK